MPNGLGLPDGSLGTPHRPTLSNGSPGTPHRLALSLLALLATVAYAPMLTIPLFEDDYPNLWQSQQLGSPAEALALLHNPVFRLRATSFWIMFLLWRVGRLAPLVYRLTSLLLHIANTWLLYGICLAWPRMRAAALWAAGFFAVAEGHQEAVMWFSAINELLQFLFGMGALWCWLRGDKLPGDKLRGGRWLRLAGVALFALALISKESAVAILPLFLLTARRSEWRRTAIRLVPYAVLAAVAVAGVVGSRDISFRFSDGSFSLHAPFWITWPSNYVRLLWIWGFAAAGAILLARDRTLRGSAMPALAWIGIGLAPYSFLLYSVRIPSRQTYLASAGLAMLCGLAMAHWQARTGSRHGVVARNRFGGIGARPPLPYGHRSVTAYKLGEAMPQTEPGPEGTPLESVRGLNTHESPRRFSTRGLIAAAAAVVLLHNVGYLWTRKRSQFLERAAPTEQLIALARRTPGPIWVRCFPRNRFIAEEAAQLGAGYAPSDLIWDEAEAARRHATAVFCWQASKPTPP